MTLRPETILVVDDEHLIRWSVEQVLRRDGYGVVQAGTGADALRLAQAESPDLVLLDIQLPDADGLEILERLRAAARVRPSASAFRVAAPVARMKPWRKISSILPWFARSIEGSGPPHTFLPGRLLRPSFKSWLGPARHAMCATSRRRLKSSSQS